jgi:hypothetical protein
MPSKPAGMETSYGSNYLAGPFAAVLVLSLRSVIAKMPVMMLPLPRHRKTLRLAVNQVDQRTSLIL